MRRIAMPCGVGVGVLAGVVAVGACGGSKEDAPPWRPAGVMSSPLGLAADGDHVYVAGTDHDRLFVVSLAARNVAAEVVVGARPESVAVGHDDRVFVAEAGARRVSVLRGPPTALAVETTLAVGAEPVALAVSPDGRTLVVACRSSDDLWAFDAASLEARWHTALARRPFQLTVSDDGFVAVGHEVEGRVSVVALKDGELVRETLGPLPDVNGHGAVPVLLPGHSERGTEVEIVVDVANTDLNGTVARDPRVPLTTPDVPPTPGDSRPDVGVGVEPGPRPTDAPVDGAADVYAPGGNDGFGGAFVGLDRGDDTFGPPSIALGQMAARGTPLLDPMGASLSPDGRFVALAARGQDLVTMAEIVGEGPRDAPGWIAELPVSAGPRATLFAAAGTVLVVDAALDHTLDVIALDSGATSRVRYAHEPFDPTVTRGRKLFFSGGDARVSRGLVSCASCHPGGRDDGRVFRFARGARNTPSLAGGVDDTLPLHWDGSVAGPRGLQSTITGLMGGTGLADEDLDAIAAYLDTVPRPDNPYATDTSAPVAAARRRGEALFRGAGGCETCHAGATFTDRQTHDGFDTPSLRGVFATAPYLHDGTAASLEGVLEVHGPASGLTANEQQDLAAFLRSL